MESKVIKITPYRGMNDEIFEGRKTKITLYPDRLDYSINFKQKGIVSKKDDETEIREVVSHSDEEGFILKDSIASIVKYIETQYEEDLTPVFINYVDVCTDANSLTFAVDSKETKDSLYKDLYEWKFNIKE